MSDEKERSGRGSRGDHPDAEPPPIALPATAAETATNDGESSASSPSSPLTAPAAPTPLERVGAFTLYVDWLPLSPDDSSPVCTAAFNQVVVRMAHPDIFAPSFEEQLADALRRASVRRAMAGYFLPVIRAEARRGP